jgi:hypothetical protein
MKKIDVMVMSPHPEDATSYWRALGPIRWLAKTESEWLSFRMAPNKITWADLAFSDILFIQRPSDARAVPIIKKAKALGMKIWVEYDDDLLNIPVSNRAYEHYARVEIRQAVTKIIASADVVTVTTEHLASVYRPLNNKIVVVPNSFEDDKWFKRNREKSKNSKIVIWRGSSTHDRDLRDYLQPILKTANERLDWKWVFIGKPCAEIYESMPQNRLMIIDGWAIPEYFDFLNTFVAEIAIVPLAENKFNFSKSNIAWQELTYLGATTLGPTWSEWTLPGITNYTDSLSFYKSINMLMDNKEKREKGLLLSEKEIETNWLLSKANSMRVRIIQDLVGIERPKPGSYEAYISPHGE